MSRTFDPRRVLRQLSNTLLEEFFRRRGELGDVPWAGLRETQIEPIFEAWQNLPETSRKEVQAILQDVHQLSDPRALAVMAEEVQWRAPGRLAEYAGWEGRLDKAMWLYLNVPEALEEATMFARADALAAGRFWVKRNSLPRQPIIVTQQTRSNLAAALSDYYWPAQMRGKFCSVEHYQRANGAEYFFAYLDDYPDTQLVFDETGQIQRRLDRDAFHNVFVFSPEDGALEMFAHGGQKAHLPLQRTFCRSILGVDVGPADPLRPAYHLDHLLDPSFPLSTEPGDGIVEARIVRMRLELRCEPLSYLELKADPNLPGDHIHTMMRLYLNGQAMPAGQLRVRQAGFKLTLRDDNGRPKNLSFQVSCPNLCDLKGKPDELRAVGERCLRRWGIVADG